jgi:hypothetical protein
MRLDPWIQRKRDVERVRAHLLRDHYPRLQMGWIVFLTGFAGLAASFLMLRAGVVAMGLRYFLAMGAAYLVFLLLLWCWMRLRGSLFDTVPDLPIGGGNLADIPGFLGRGGTFDGGGASGNFDVAAAVDAGSAVDATAASGDVAGTAGDALGAAGDAAVPLAVAALVGGIAISVILIVYSAPLLFAELVVDGVLAAGLYRRMQQVDHRHWLASAMSRTFWPFVISTAFVTLAGCAMGFYAPDAHTLGQVLQHRQDMKALKQ